MTCSCGMEVPVEANSKEEAVEMIKDIMMPKSADGTRSLDGVLKHLAEEPKHAGEPPPTLEQALMQVEQNTVEVVAA